MDTSTKSSHAVILQYHHVDSKTPHATSISPEKFSEHIQWLEHHHFQIWPLDKIVSYLKSGNAIPDKVAAITFDDGYRNNFDNAYPLLKQRNWPFTVFLNTDPVERGFSSHMSWQQLQEMQDNGTLIANHSATHPFMLRRLEEKGESEKDWLQRIKNEVTNAQQSIEKHLGSKVKLFAYPYGESSPEIRQLLTRLGYTAFGQHSGPVGSNSDFSNLPRFAVAGDYADLSKFAEKMWSLPLPVSQFRVLDNSSNEILPNKLSKPQLELSFAELPVPLSKITCFATGQGRLKSTVLERRQTLHLQLEKPLPIGRSRINCTAPSALRTDDKRIRFYWYSQQVIRLGEHNQWQHE